MLVPATQMSTKVAARLGGKLSEVASRAQGVNPLVLLIFNSKKGLGTPGFKKLFEISLLSLSFFNIVSMGY